MRSRPAYALQSVDAAMRLALMLQTFGPMRLSDVAVELRISASTAHRLLATLAYRGFVEQLADRRYGAGPAMRPARDIDPGASALRGHSLVPMAALVKAVGESANLVVLAGTDVRFVATVECDRVLRVGDRSGERLPAHLASGGKAILAGLPDAELDRFEELGAAALSKLRHEVHAARRAGYATNHQGTERGLTAIGVALAPLPGPIRAAVCLAMPSARYRRSALDGYVSALRDTARAIEDAVAGPSPHAAQCRRT